jgi:hypothetical protein
MGLRASGCDCSGAMRGIAGRDCCAMWGASGYVTMDEWESREAYEEFREKNAAEYAGIDKKCEALTHGESPLLRYPL